MQSVPDCRLLLSGTVLLTVVRVVNLLSVAVEGVFFIVVAAGVLRWCGVSDISRVVVIRGTCSCFVVCTCLRVVGYCGKYMHHHATHRQTPHPKSASAWYGCSSQRVTTRELQPESYNQRVTTRELQPESYNQRFTLHVQKK